MGSTPFNEPYPTEAPDMERMREMDRSSEPVFRKWIERQEQRECRKDRLSLGVNIAVGLIVLALLVAPLAIRIFGGTGQVSPACRLFRRDCP